MGRKGREGPFVVHIVLTVLIPFNDPLHRRNTLPNVFTTHRR